MRFDAMTNVVHDVVLNSITAKSKESDPIASTHVSPREATKKTTAEDPQASTGDASDSEEDEWANDSGDESDGFVDSD